MYDLPFDGDEEEEKPVRPNKIFSIQIKNMEDAKLFIKKETNTFINNALLALKAAQNNDNEEVKEFTDEVSQLRISASEGDFERSLFLCNLIATMVYDMSFDWIRSVPPLTFGINELKIESMRKGMLSGLMMLRSFNAVFYKKFPQSTWESSR